MSMDALREKMAERLASRDWSTLWTQWPKLGADICVQVVAEAIEAGELVPADRLEHYGWTFDDKELVRGLTVEARGDVIPTALLRLQHAPYDPYDEEPPRRMPGVS